MEQPFRGVVSGAGQIARNAHRCFQIAVTLGSDEILGLFALLFEIQDYPPLLRCPLCRLEDSPMIWNVEKKSRRARPFPRTRCTLEGATSKYMSFAASK